MGNREANRTNRMLDESYRSSRAGYNSLFPTMNQDLNRARVNETELRGQIGSLYGGMARGENLTPGMRPNEQGWFNLPGYNDPNSDFNRARAGFNNFANTGGFNRGNFDEALAGYRGFADTGGFRAGEEDAFRAAATQPIAGFYSGLRNDLDRRRAVQGGYLPGFDEATAEMARQAARQGHEAAVDAEGRLVGMRQSGRQFGTSGLANIANQLSGLEQQGRMAGLQGLSNIGGQELGAQLDLARLYGQNQLAGAGGLLDLYRSAPGESNAMYNNILAGLQGRDAASQGYLGQRMQNNPRRDWLATGMQLAGGVGGLMTGLGPLGMGLGAGLPGADVTNILRRIPGAV